MDGANKWFEKYFNTVLKHKLISNNDKNSQYNHNIGNIQLNPQNKFNMVLKNQFCLINLTDNYLYKDSFCNSEFIKLYEHFASSNVALICCGGVYPNLKGFNNPTIIDNANSRLFFIEFTKKIHSYGTKIFLQIKSNFGRFDTKNKYAGVLSYSSSFNPNYMNSRVKCVRISDRKCFKIADEFTRLSEFAKNSGFDGVLIDGSLNGILGEFSSKEFNKRKIGYFSKINNFALEVMNCIVDKCGKYPIIYKLNINSFIKEIFKDNLNNIKTLKHVFQQTTFDEVLNLLSELVSNGVDGFVFEFGLKENDFLTNFTPYIDGGIYNEFYKYIKEYFHNKNLKNKFGENIVIISNIDYAELNSENECCDLFDVTKNLYANNNFIYNQKTQKISNLCIKCNKCNDFCNNYGYVDCVVNPYLGNYTLNNITSSSNKNKVAVIGAGISGIICATTLAKRGYNVDLYEKNSSINFYGKLNSVFGSDDSVENFNNYLNKEINNYIKKCKISLFLDTKFTINNNTNIYNSIVVATGFHEKFLNVSGAVQKHVKSIYDFLSSKKILSNFKKIAIYAKSELSLKLALYLSTIGKKVSIIIKSPEFLFKMPNANFTYYIWALNSLKVKIYITAQIKKIDEDSVELLINNKLNQKDYFATLLNMKSKNHYKYTAQSKTIDAEIFVYEPDLISNNKLYYELVQSGFKGKLFMIGNALTIGDMYDDIKSGFYVGKNL